MQTPGVPRSGSIVSDAPATIVRVLPGLDVAAVRHHCEQQVRPMPCTRVAPSVLTRGAETIVERAHPGARTTVPSGQAEVSHVFATRSRAASRRADTRLTRTPRRAEDHPDQSFDISSGRRIPLAFVLTNPALRVDGARRGPLTLSDWRREIQVPKTNWNDIGTMTMRSARVHPQKPRCRGAFPP
jgi:hypothetical protein